MEYKSLKAHKPKGNHPWGFNSQTKRKLEKTLFSDDFKLLPLEEQKMILKKIKELN